MPPRRNQLKLPQQLLKELGESDSRPSARSGGRGRTTRSTRKEERKATRVEERVQRPEAKRQRASKTYPKPKEAYLAQSPDRSSDNELENQGKSPSIPADLGTSEKSETQFTGRFRESSVDRGSRTLQKDNDPSERRSKQPKIPHAVAAKLADDDAEIKALERALGIKGRKKTPKTFELDGLGEVLGDIDGSDREQELHRKKRRERDGDEWLQEKRRRAKIAPDLFLPEELPSNDDSDDTDQGSGSMDASLAEPMLHPDKEDFEGFEDKMESKTPSQTQRENPYLPAIKSNEDTIPIYVPPSLRIDNTSEHENMSRLKRQMQGTLNRLSEANMLSIVGEIEKLFHHNARQHVFSLLLNLLYGLVADTSPLQDTFMILHGGFVAALHKVLGNEFIAQIIQRFVEEFESALAKHRMGHSTGKQMSNLVTFLAELYNFQVIGSDLVYDYIRLFVADLSEDQTELLLKIARLSGAQLRQDDPSSLKDIVLLIQSAVARVGFENLSVRTKLMIETIENLKNNRVKTGLAASSIASEHTTRMRRTLGSMNKGSIKATEPLRLTLNDIQNSNKRGKWWLVGASYRDKDHTQPGTHVASSRDVEDSPDFGSNIDATNDLLQLAQEQRMNTDIRRSVFITIMSSNDYKDATQRLMRLRLKKTQELEIPKVLLHCAGAEKAYNPFYTLIARHLCEDRKIRMAFQFCLWDVFKRIEANEEDLDDEVEGQLDMRALVNLAKMYGSLVADGKLSISLLKNLDLTYLQPKTRSFVEILLATVFIDVNRGTGKSGYGVKIGRIFMECRSAPDTISGLQLFLKNNVSRSDILNSSKERSAVKEGCKQAETILASLATDAVQGEDLGLDSDGQ